MTKNELSPIQKEMLDILLKNAEDPLTIREIQKVLEISSTSVVAHHLTQLERKGYLKRNPYNPKDYQVLTDAPEKPIVYLNLYGLAQCGPNGSILEGDPIDRIPISNRLISFAASEAFLVKAKGDSMTPKIHEGDLIVAKQSPSADNGDIIVCVNDGMALIKKFQKENDKVILTSLNSQNYEPFLASEDFKIEGIVKGIISYEPNL